MLFRSPKGAVIRSFVADNTADTTRHASDSIAGRKAVTDSVSYYAADSIPRIKAGTNRFFWNLHYPDARELRNTVIDEGSLGGPAVPPGMYSVRLIVGKDTSSKQFAVVADPRSTSTTADLVAQFEAAMRVRARLNELVEKVERLEDLQSQLDARAQQTKDQPFAKQVADAAKAARAKLEAVRGELFETGCHVDQCTLDQPVRLYNWFITLNSQLQTGAYAPTQQHGEVFTDLSGKLDVQLKALEQIENDDIRKFNEMLQGLGIPSVFVKPKAKPPIS